MKICGWILIFFSCVAFVLSGYSLFNVITHPLNFETEILNCSQKYNLSPALIASVINVESSFNVNARSNKNAIGLMQIKLTTANYMNDLNNAEALTENELFKPETNIDLGCSYLRYLINKFEDINTAICAYNAGETNVRNWLKSGIYSLDGKTLMYVPFLETRNYIKKVNENIKYYNKVFH